MKWLPLLGAALFLTACAPQQSGGTVSSKEHIPALWGTSCDGSPQVCHRTITDCWSVNYWNGSEHGHACVDKAVYDSIKIGDHYGK